MKIYYVSNTGKDSNNGLSVASPLLTIAKASAIAKPGDTIKLNGGDTFREVLTAISGTSGNPVVFESYGTGKAIVSGCETIALTNWGVHKGSILKTVLLAAWNLGTGKDKVFIDGDPMLPAIWPKNSKPLHERRMTDYAIAISASFDPTPDANGKATGSYEAPGIDTSWVGKKITFLPGSAWGAQIGEIISAGNNKVSFKFTYNSFNNAYNPVVGNYFFLWDNLAALTQPNEYYLDTATNTLYLWPNSSITNKKIELKVRTIGCNLDKLSYVTIRNINFFATRLTAKNGSNLKVEGCSFREYHNLLSGESVMDFSNSPNSSVINCDICIASGEGLILNASNCNAINNSVYGVGYNSISGTGINVAGGNCLIDSNTVISTGAHGIGMQSPAGICQYNRVADIGRWTTDVAGINVAGSSTVGTGNMKGLRINNNVSHDHSAIFDNKKALWGASGFRADSGFPEGVSNIVFDHNLSWNTSNESITVFPLNPTQTNYENAQIKLINNTFQKKIFLVVRSGASQQGIEIQNNIASGIYGNSEAVIANNLFAYNPLANKNVIVSNGLFSYPMIENNISDDPKLKSPNNLDYRLEPDSPCLGSGKIIPPFTPSASVDMGAIQHDEKPPKFGATILLEQISNLVFTQKSAAIVEVSGFPIARGFGKNVTFRYVINGVYVSEDYCWDSYDPATRKLTGKIKFPTPTQNLGNVAIEISIDGGETFVATNGIFKVESTSNPDKRIPLKAATLNGSILAYDASIAPVVYKVPVAKWITQSKISSANKIRVEDRNGNKQPFWLDGITTTNSPSLLWVKTASPQPILPQDYDGSPILYLNYDNSNLENINELQSVFPEMSDAFIWLKSHEAIALPNTNLDNWLGVGKASQTAQTKQPILRRDILNGFPGIEFDGIDDFMTVVPSIGNPVSATLFAFYCNPNPGYITYQRLISASSPGTRDYEIGLQLLPTLLTANLPVAQSAGFLISQIATSKDLTNLHLGIRHTTLSNAYKGYLLEVLVFDRIMTSSEINKIKVYFKTKYQSIIPSLSIF